MRNMFMRQVMRLLKQLHLRLCMCQCLKVCGQLQVFHFKSMRFFECLFSICKYFLRIGASLAPLIGSANTYSQWA
jgi:hypothetical protein